jgi:hypothetical protein
MSWRGFESGFAAYPVLLAEALRLAAPALWQSKGLCILSKSLFSSAAVTTNQRKFFERVVRHKFITAIVVVSSLWLD